MASSFNYTISTDITAAKVDVERLKLDIEASSITIQTSSINSHGDALDVSFKTDISAAEETTLGAVVLAHSGEPVEYYQKIKTQPEMPEGGKKKTDRGFSFTATAGQTTTHDYSVTEDLQIKGGVLFCDKAAAEIKDSVSMEIVDTAYMWAGVWYPATPTEAGIPGVEGLTWAQVVPTGVSLHHYLKDFPIDTESGKTSVKNDAITTTPLNGLTIRITYNSTGASNVDCNIGIVAYS